MISKIYYKISYDEVDIKSKSLWTKSVKVDKIFGKLIEKINFLRLNKVLSFYSKILELLITFIDNYYAFMPEQSSQIYRLHH